MKLKSEIYVVTAMRKSTVAKELGLEVGHHVQMEFDTRQQGLITTVNLNTVQSKRQDISRWGGSFDDPDANRTSYRAPIILEKLVTPETHLPDENY